MATQGSRELELRRALERNQPALAGSLQRAEDRQRAVAEPAEPQQAGRKEPSSKPKGIKVRAAGTPGAEAAAQQGWATGVVASLDGFSTV
jgi:hypothetical protein